MLPYATVAAAGSAQTDAAEISARLNIVTGGDGSVGVRLSGAQRCRELFVYNAATTGGVNVYPHVGGDINDGTQNAAVVIEGKTLAMFVCLDGTTWASIFTADT